MKTGILILGFMTTVCWVLSIPVQAEDLSNWNIISYTNEYREGCGVAVIQGYMYAIGGLFSDDSVERAPILPDGTLGTWEYIPNIFPILGLSSFATITANNSIYIIGGYSYASSGWGFPVEIGSIERAIVNSDSTLGPWSILSSSLVVPCDSFAWAVYNNILYIISGDNDMGGASEIVQQGSINPDGSLGPFVLSTTVLSQVEEGLSAAVYQNYIITAGGTAGYAGARAPTNVAKIYPDGQLGAWVATNTTNHDHEYGATITDGYYLYEFGGFNPVERTQLYSNGSIGNWEDVNDLNIERGSLGAWMNFPYIYAVDGENAEYGNSNGDLNSVERAMIIPTAVEKKYWKLLY
jgi:hypothetical protein